MNLARQINNILDKISAYKENINELKIKFNNPAFELVDLQTGDLVTKEFALNKAEEEIKLLEEVLKSITNNGQNCRDLFSNDYYVNDLNQETGWVEPPFFERLEELVYGIDTGNYKEN